MRVLHWCMLGVTILLLVCEVTISQLCKSLITLVDSFHTLFILMRMALPLPQTAGSTGGSSTPDEPPAPGPNHDTTLPFSSHGSCPPTVSPPALNCSVSYGSSRIQVMGAFLSSLILISLSISYLIMIINFFLEPRLVQRPLLLVVIGVVSLLHKMLVLWLNWDQLQEEMTGASRQPETKSHLEVNHKVLAKEGTRGLAEPGQVQDDVSHVQSAVDDSLHNGTLVLCNPGTSSFPDTDSQTPVHLHAADPQDSWDCDVVSGFADLKIWKCESHSKDITEIFEDNTSMGHRDNKNASKTSPVCKSSHHAKSPVPSSRWPVCLLSFLLIAQGLFTPLLVLINSLVMLLVDPHCSILDYLDTCLTLPAVIVLIAIAKPEVCRYGLLLLQATPPHICVTDLGRRIASVPGVQAVHDLHVWQLTESFMVATVHVHCHAGFPAHRCADMMSGVTKVLKSVGVSCCTVQPEFASCSGRSAGSGGDASAVVHREDPSLPPLLTCSLSCGKACSGSMCCSSPGEETRSLLAPPAGETKEEPQTLVIENTFL
ncbi:uncharacterized protein LOC108889245 isoform X6 [Lates calcarifer]|uniref:Uncharacterized protein LOC108889245 isoform X6 n=1 Tax=Lates calcarifer TaxID=8187 RepID=A0AAJ8BMB2_LATCA|nr:uncharacterized protein LOC108889245 isoform X6 [Lates calcarifer]